MASLTARWYAVKLPAQRDDDMTVPFAGTQIHAEHWAPSCFSSEAGSRPGGEFTTHSTPSIRPTLIASGALLLWAHNFIGNEVHTKLAAQQIYFPASNSPAIKARSVGPRGAVIGVGTVRDAMASDPGGLPLLSIHATVVSLSAPGSVRTMCSLAASGLRIEGGDTSDGSCDQAIPE